MTSPRRPLLHANLRWFLLAMILANIAGQMGYSMMSLYLVDLGAECEAVEKSGAWFAFEGERIGQGRENAKLFLKQNPKIADKIEKAIRANAGLIVDKMLVEPDARGSEDGEEPDADGVLPEPEEEDAPKKGARGKR